MRSTFGVRHIECIFLAKSVFISERSEAKINEVEGRLAKRKALCVLFTDNWSFSFFRSRRTLSSPSLPPCLFVDSLVFKNDLFFYRLHCLARIPRLAVQGTETDKFRKTSHGGHVCAVCACLQHVSFSSPGRYVVREE